MERLKREYAVDCTVGNPNVNYRETIRKKAPFNYLHKKQSGGQGQYARVIGYVEPLEEEEGGEGGRDGGQGFEFVNRVVGTNIPPEYIPSCEKGAKDAMEKGPLTGMFLPPSLPPSLPAISLPSIFDKQIVYFLGFLPPQATPPKESAWSSSMARFTQRTLQIWLSVSLALLTCTRPPLLPSLPPSLRPPLPRD